MVGNLNHETSYRSPDSLSALARNQIAVFGLGSLGSHLAVSLGRLGAKLSLVDRDKVEGHNPATQHFIGKDLGDPKVYVLRDYLEDIWDQEVQAVYKDILKLKDFRQVERPDLVLDCLDNSAGRSLIQKWVRAENLPCLHLGFNGGFAALRWDEVYQVPSDQGEDDCDYPLSLGLCLMTAAVSLEVVFSWLAGQKRNFDISLPELKVTEVFHLLPVG